MKQNFKLIKLNPYHIHEKYNCYKRDKVSDKAKFSESAYIRIHYSWAIKKISKFIRLYSFMRSKTLAVLNKEMYIDELMSYSIDYIDFIKNLEEFNKCCINKTIKETDEENSSALESIKVDSSKVSSIYSDNNSSNISLKKSKITFDKNNLTINSKISHANRSYIEREKSNPNIIKTINNMFNNCSPHFLYNPSPYTSPIPKVFEDNSIDVDTYKTNSHKEFHNLPILNSLRKNSAKSKNSDLNFGKSSINNEKSLKF